MITDATRREMQRQYLQTRTELVQDAAAIADGIALAWPLEWELGDDKLGRAIAAMRDLSNHLRALGYGLPQPEHDAAN